MELQIIALNLIYTVVGVVLMYVSFRLFDRLTPKVSFEDELKAGNIAVAIFIGSMFVGIAMIISGALN